MSDWKIILEDVAPWIGAAATVGVPALVALAAVELAKAIGEAVDPTEEGICKALDCATNDQLRALGKCSRPDVC
jgi:hypothetical protein